MAFALLWAPQSSMPQREPPNHQPSFDDFDIAERIGIGGMAEVFRARWRAHPERAVVIKRILPAYREHPDFRELLMQEANIGRRLRHANIVKVLSAGLGASDEPYIVMEYVDGIDVERLAWSMSKPGVPVWLAVHITSEALVGLAHAHGQVDDAGRAAPIIHRDISPENLLVTKSGRIKVTDFGVASRGRVAKTAPRGKLPYMAPELFSEEPADARTDLFAVGVVLWELLTGRHLFRGGSPQEVIAQVCGQPRVPPSRLNPGVPGVLDEVVISALAPKRHERPSNALVMHAALQRVLEIIRPGSLVTPTDVDAIIRPHLGAARAPKDALLERPLENIDELLGLADEQLFAEPDEVVESGETTYAFIRRAPENRQSADDLLREYIEEPPIRAARGFVDTLDLAPGAHVMTPPPPIVRPDAYDGPDPVWVDTPHGQQGPLRPARALSYLRDQPPETYPEIRLSANGARWVNLDRVAYLLDDELVAPTLELDNCDMQGRIDDVSMTAILGTFARGHATSRLIFARPDRLGVERYELEVVGGQVVAVHNNELFFEVWGSVFDNPYLEQLGLGAAFHSALKDDRRLYPRLPYESQLALQTSRGLAKRRALSQVFAWHDGVFGSNGNVLSQPNPHSVPILPFLPRLIARGIDADMIRARIAAYIRRPLWRAPTFNAEVARLRLRRTERVRAEAFGYGRTLFESLEFANEGRTDLRYSQILAYLLLELGLLREGNPADATPA